MNMTKALFRNIIITIFAISIVWMFYTVLPYKQAAPGDRRNIYLIQNASVSVDGAETTTTLPYTVKNQKPGTLIHVVCSFPAYYGDYVYVKTSYSPMEVYGNGEFLYSYGNAESRPFFMHDPASSIQLVSLKKAKLHMTDDSDETIDLTINYYFPNTKNSFTVTNPVVSNLSGLILHCFKNVAIGFALSSFLVLTGFILLIIHYINFGTNNYGYYFLWISLFCIAVGVWIITEIDATIFIFHNATLLYLLTFISMNALDIPIYGFITDIVNFHSIRPKIEFCIQIIGNVIFILLQLSGLLMFSKMVPFLHLFLLLGMVCLLFELIYESIIYKSKNATRCIPPIVLLIIASVIETANYYFSWTVEYGFIFEVGGFICIVFLLGIAVKVLNDFQRIRELAAMQSSELRIMEAKLNQQKKSQDLIIKNEEKLKIMRHDLRHQLNVIRSLSMEDDKNKLAEYIDSMIDAIPVKPKSYCKNIAVNAIISHYVALAEEKDIKCNISLTVPEHSENVSDMELCIIYGNLLENAIEACSLLSNNADKFIKMNDQVRYDKLIITMDNSSKSPHITADDQFISSKRNEVGIGLRSIHSVAEKHGGNTSFNYTDGVFHSSIYLDI